LSELDLFESVIGGLLDEGVVVGALQMNPLDSIQPVFNQRRLQQLDECLVKMSNVDNFNNNCWATFVS